MTLCTGAQLYRPLKKSLLECLVTGHDHSVCVRTKPSAGRWSKRCEIQSAAGAWHDSPARSVALGKVGKTSESPGDDRVLTHTLQSCRMSTPKDSEPALAGGTTYRRTTAGCAGSRGVRDPGDDMEVREGCGLQS